MFKRLLVLLDGSPFAETALPVAAALAQLTQAEVTLLHVIEHNAPAAVHSVRHLTNADEACAYLNEIAARAFPATLKVDCHVHTEEVSHVARSIVEHAVELQADLIVMCAHGHGGPRRFLFGSNAQQIIALGRTPVLLIPPRSSGTTSDFNCRRILVPLDGNPDHEQGLPVAVDLAQICGAAIHLVEVVPNRETLKDEKAATGKLLPLTTTVLLEMEQQGASDYLQGQIQQLQSAGISVSAEVSRGDPVAAVVEAAKRIKADLIMLGTHGKTGLDAFWSGSITPRVLEQSAEPLLLVRIHLAN
jgi:nucleotide-binding universal stress UspA family protein